MARTGYAADVSQVVRACRTLWYFRRPDAHLYPPRPYAHAARTPRAGAAGSSSSASASASSSALALRAQPSRYYFDPGAVADGLMPDAARFAADYLLRPPARCLRR